MLQTFSRKLNIRFIGVILGSLLFFGCAGFDKTPTPTLSFLSHSKLYRGSYDKVWRSIQIALSSYPIKVNNIDTGLIETRSVADNEIFKVPFEDSKASNGRRYIIKIRVIRMVPKDGNEQKSAVKVIVKKDITLKRDFFAAPERLRSNGIEEKTILYRVGRELLIDRVIEKAAQNSSPNL
ncbi:MAG: hypothetical protein CL677_08710 [Bdellovibrionaceae bacterium]|nr:hypothetical protein [Pseudobdellovibrionaceae bacterium]|tara:strand:+ start:26252 stop:26791 length:540 start_codon:yes stop_codon:yes gene_type:complete